MPAVEPLTKPQLPDKGAQPGDLGTDEGRYYLCMDSLYVAMRCAERGMDPVYSAQALKKAQFQINGIQDAKTRDACQGWHDTVGNYCDSLAPQAATLKQAADVSDTTYQKSQVLTAAQQEAYSTDNADTQRALDAAARGENPTIAYNAGYVSREAAAAAAGISGAAANVLGSALAPWKWWIAGIALVAAVAAGVYGYSLKQAAGAAKGAA